MSIQPQRARTAIALTAALLSAGCYSTTPIALRDLPDLHRYRDGLTVYVREENDPNDLVRYDEKSELVITWRSGVEQRYAFEKIRVEGAWMSGVTRDDRKLHHINLWRVESASVRSPSPGAAAGVFAGVAGGFVALSVFFLLAASGFGSSAP
jgi:hypothetical protein